MRTVDKNSSNQSCFGISSKSSESENEVNDVPTIELIEIRCYKIDCCKYSLKQISDEIMSILEFR